MIQIKCPCGTIITTFPSRQFRTKYCSQKCKYIFRKRPSGLTYKIKTINKGWFKKGHKTFNKGFRSNFNGKSYDGLHDWVERNLGKPKKCVKCGSEKNIEWSNKSGQYLADKKDWQRLCKKCHCRYDYLAFGKRKGFYK